MNKKILSVISMFLGISLSCITNLITGDNRIVSWFESNKYVVIIIGVTLTIFSLIVSYLYETDSETDITKKRNTVKSFTNMILNSVNLFIMGIILTAIFIWLNNKYASHIVYHEYFPLLLIGSLVGTEFKNVGGKMGEGAIAGALLAVAFSYYFPENVGLDFLPKWLNNNTIVSSGVFCGIIGLYTGIYKDDVVQKEKEDAKTKELRKQKDMDDYASFKEFFNLHHYQLLANIFTDDLKRAKLKVAGANKEMIEAFKEIESKKKQEEKSSFTFIKEVLYSVLKENINGVIKVKPPFYLYDQNFKLVKKFQSLEEIRDFIKNGEINKRW